MTITWRLYVLFDVKCLNTQTLTVIKQISSIWMQHWCFYLYLSFSLKLCLLWVGSRKLHSITPMTPAPWLLACRRQQLTRDEHHMITFGTAFTKWTTNTLTITAETNLKLAAHTFIGFDEPILVIHHDAVLVFTFGVIPKSNTNSFVLK